MQTRLSPAKRSRERFRSAPDVVAHLAMRLGFHVCLLFYYGALGGALAVDVSSAEAYKEVAQQGSPIMQVILTSGGLYAIALIVSSRPATALLGLCWPHLVLCGMAVVSLTWSVDPSLTLRRGTTLVFCTLLSVALVGRLGLNEAIRLLVRSMTFVCVLSVIWVALFPEIAIHQATDSFQNVHAGLWRGVYGHKVALGTFAGLTLGFLLFYGWRCFASPVSFCAGAAAALACVLGSGSATGLMCAAVMAGLLYTCSWLLFQPHGMRQTLIRNIIGGLVVLAAVMFTGTLDTFASMLGRSSDLTGRADYWPYVLDFMHHGSFVLGYGYAAGFRLIGPLIAEDSGSRLTEAHNGVIELIVAFGYVGTAIVVWVHLLLFWWAAGMLMRVAPRTAPVSVLPFSFLGTYFMTSYVESIILSHLGQWQVLFSVVTVFIVLSRSRPGWLRDHYLPEGADARCG